MASSTAAERVFRCPTEVDVQRLTRLTAGLTASKVNGESRACLFDIVEGSGDTWASMSVVSPYIDEAGAAVSVEEARYRLIDIRDSWVEAAKTDDSVVIPFEIVDQPDLGDGAFSAPSHDPDGRGCEVYFPTADNRTTFIFFDNGEDEHELRIPDPDLACRAALAVAASLKE